MYEARAASILRDFERDGIPFSFEVFEAEMFATQTASAKAAPILADYTRQIADELAREKRHGIPSYTEILHTCSTCTSPVPPWAK